MVDRTGSAGRVQGGPDGESVSGFIDRRGLFRWAGAAGMLGVAGFATGCVSSPSGEGIQLEGVSGEVLLPPGFEVRIVALSGRPNATGYAMPAFPDGAATFEDPVTQGGWYLTVNHEVPLDGGVTSFRFAPDGTLVASQRVLSGTSLNCAGGATPWGTWLSCEEFDWGQVWECDPTGANPPRVRPAMGAFYHEAAAVAADERIYLTEDRSDGGFYRFTPDSPGDLSAGVLEVATGVAPGPTTWVEVPDPSGFPVLVRDQVADAMRFDGGEGIDTSGDSVWFTTKGDDRVWLYDIAGEEVSLRFQGAGTSMLSGVDNLWVDEASQALLIAEDGDDMQIVALAPDNSLFEVVRVLGQDHSEITGPCFSPDGQRLYFSSQRAQVGPVGGFGAPVGATYEVTGPFDSLLGRP